LRINIQNVGGRKSINKSIKNDSKNVENVLRN